MTLDEYIFRNRAKEMGYDIGDIKAFSDFELTMEVNISSIPRETLQTILGGLPIVRCRDCVKHMTDRCCFFYRDENAMSGPGDEFYCADGELRERSESND